MQIAFDDDTDLKRITSISSGCFLLSHTHTLIDSATLLTHYENQFNRVI